MGSNVNLFLPQYNLGLIDNLETSKEEKMLLQQI